MSKIEWADFQNLTEEEKTDLWNNYEIDSSGLTLLAYQKMHPFHKKPMGKYTKRSIMEKVASMTPREKFDYLCS